MKHSGKASSLTPCLPESSMMRHFGSGRLLIHEDWGSMDGGCFELDIWNGN